MSLVRIHLAVGALLFGHLVAPTSASAQWYVAGSLGGNHSQTSTVSIRVPPDNLSLDFHDVKFSAQSSYPRRYYGLRIGRFGSPQRRIGFEFEMIHLKAIADTSREYPLTVGAGSLPPPGGASPMNLVVQEYQMTHGVNLAVVNVVIRQPLGTPRVALMMRGGFGSTFPHGETTVNGGTIHHYEFGGPGAQGAAGIQVGLVSRVSAMAEYKYTWARPTIDVVGGSGWTTLLSHHFSTGVTVALTN